MLPVKDAAMTAKLKCGQEKRKLTVGKQDVGIHISILPKPIHFYKRQEDATMKIKKITKIMPVNIQGQGCLDDCTEYNQLVGKSNPNTSGCVYYDVIYTPKLSDWL